jgi:hypothetical protein
MRFVKAADGEKMIKIWLRTVIVLTLAAILAGCVLLRPIDLRLEALSVGNVAADGSLLKFAHEAVTGDPARARFLKVSVSSETDLVQFAKSHGYHVGYSFHVCDARTLEMRDEIYSPADLQVGDRWLDGANYSALASLESMRGIDRRITYLAILPLDSPEMRSLVGNRGDLYRPSQSSADICLRVRGGSMVGGSFESRPIAIAREQVVRAIR